jgi:hypothetical protein
MTLDRRPTPGEVACNAYEAAQAAWQAADQAHGTYLSAVLALPSVVKLATAPRQVDPPTVPPWMTEDNPRTVLLCLPEATRVITPIDEDWYLASAIAAVVRTVSPRRNGEALRVRSVAKDLGILGFTERRHHARGTLIRISPEAVLAAHLRHRVTPTEAVAVSVLFRDFAAYRGSVGSAS